MATDGKAANNSLASTLTDLMTSLMVIFVLLLVATLNNTSVEGESKRNIMLDHLKEVLQDFTARGLHVDRDSKDPLALLVLVPENFFAFETNKSDIPGQGVEFLQIFAPRLAEIATNERFRNEISSIVVEGHADSRGSYEHNLQLSQERAMSVVRNMLNILGTTEESKMQSFLDFLSANGRGNREPIVDAYGNEDLDRSRRVVFKIRVRSIEQREIRELLGS